jgi:hypothetical protein
MPCLHLQHLLNVLVQIASKMGFLKKKKNPIPLLVDGVYLDEPSAVAEAFASHFQSVYNEQCRGKAELLPALDTAECLVCPFRWQHLQFF